MVYRPITIVGVAYKKGKKFRLQETINGFRLNSLSFLLAFH